MDWDVIVALTLLSLCAVLMLLFAAAFIKEYFWPSQNTGIDLDKLDRLRRKEEDAKSTEFFDKTEEFRNDFE